MNKKNIPRFCRLKVDLVGYEIYFCFVGYISNFSQNQKITLKILQNSPVYFSFIPKVRAVLLNNATQVVIMANEI